MRRFIAAATLLVIVAGVCATEAHAQSDSLSNLIPSKVFSRIRLDPSPPGTAGAGGHSAHFDIFNQQYGSAGDADAIYENQTELAAELNRQLGSQLSTFPLGSSAGGFSFTLDPTLGTFSRSSDSFGPLFAQRAFTVGRNRLSLGMNYLRRTFDSYEGRSLPDADIKLYFPHNDCCGLQPAPTPDGTTLNLFFEGDVIEAGLGLNMDSTTVTMFGNYGITDRFDVGVAVPIINVDMKTELHLRIMRLSTQSDVRVHSFDGQGLDTETLPDAGSATGIGDVTIRGKVRFFDAAGGGLALAADLRLPTGDELDLLGTGATQFTATFIGSGLVGKFSPHVNIGYTVSGDISDEAKANFLAAPPDEFDYTFGADIAVTPRFTVAGDFIGRTLFDVGRLIDTDLTFRFRTTNGGPDQSTVVSAFGTEPGNLTLLTASAGVKFNLTRTVLFSASVLFALNDVGLRDAFTPVLGLDYTFGK